MKSQYALVYAGDVAHVFWLRPSDSGGCPPFWVHLHSGDYRCMEWFMMGVQSENALYSVFHRETAVTAAECLDENKMPKMWWHGEGPYRTGDKGIKPAIS